MKTSFRYKFYQFLSKFSLGFDATKNPKVQNMLKTISELKGGKIIFQITMDEDGNWAAEALNLDGLITGGYITDNFNDMITDAIFTYFDIPPAYCDDNLLIKSNINAKNSRKAAKRRMFTMLPYAPTPA